MDFIEKAKGLLTTDPEITFDASKDDTLEEAIKYYAVIVAVYSFLSTVVISITMKGSFGSMMGIGQLETMMGVGAGIIGAVVLFVVMLVLGIIGAFIGGALVHVGVLIVGGKKGITQTIKAIMYGSTPGLLLGWIPIIGGLAGIWSFVLEIVGIQQLHDLTTFRTIMAVIIPLVIIVVFLVLITVFGAFVIGMTGGGY
ncbi:MAG: YIP1 family protein [Spirochaetes bacterium]|nr:YIP1 family protein [Spirochaetota bacterium]